MYKRHEYFRGLIFIITIDLSLLISLSTVRGRNVPNLYLYSEILAWLLIPVN